MSSLAVLIPVKSFGDAKRRLAPALPPRERAALAQSMAERVVAAARGLPVTIVCDDEGVAEWASKLETTVLRAPGRGLNGAVARGIAALAEQGAEHVIVAHADLPLAEDLRWVGRFRGVTLVPDTRDDGTNVACVPAGAAFEFSYGAGSFARHLAEARRLGLPLRVVRASALSHDLDLPADLALAEPR